MASVQGVGADAPVETNMATGAKQSMVPYRCDLLPPLAAMHVAGIFHEGSEKYGDWNWLSIPLRQQLNHALIHINCFLAGDTSDDHLGHATCRMEMALERHLMDRLDGRTLAVTPHQVLTRPDKSLKMPQSDMCSSGPPWCLLHPGTFFATCWHASLGEAC